MAIQLFKNNAASNLSGTLTQGGTTIVLATGTGDRFPSPAGGNYFLLTLFEKDESGIEEFIEVVKVTARTADTLTVVRDFESMTGQTGGYAYPSVANRTVYVELRWTAAGADNFAQKSANLSDIADPANARANLGISAANTPFTPTGTISATDVQAAITELAIEKEAQDATLDALAGLTTAANKLPYFTGVDAAAVTDLTVFGRSLIDDADAATARTTLGLGSAAVQAETYFALSTRTVSSGTGLSGGGDLSANRTISLANTTVVASNYGSATQVGTFTVNAQGQLTAASNVTVTPAWSSITSKPTTLSGYGITDAITAATAASTYQALSGRNAANGYAGLDGSGLISSTLLPSYVDDVLEYAALANFPATGETGKIYVALDTNKTYRWSGSAYVEISASPGSTDSVTEGSVNLYFTQARARASISVTQNLTYNSATGVITGPNLSGYLTANQSITVSGDASGTGKTDITLTLANTAVTAGSYGSATATPTFTVDNKGRLTAAGSLTITPAWSSITGKPSTLSGYGITDGLTSSDAASTYQTQAGMSSYLTTATAASTYQTQAGMSSYLTTATAASTYQTQAGMSSYLTTSSASSTYLALAGGALTGGLREAKVAMGANDISLTAGNYFTKTISTATTLTVSNVPTTGTAASFILDLTNGGAGTITWWTGMKWAGGTAPTLTASGRDVLGFFTYDNGTTWTGLVLGKDVK